MKTTTRDVGKVTVIDLDGKITIGKGDLILREAVEKCLNEGKTRILLNLGGVTYMDSAGIGELVACFKRVKETDGMMKLVNPGGRVQDLLALCLPRFGFDVGFACVKADKFPHIRRATKTPLYQISMRSRFDLSAIRHLRRIVKEGDFDVLHAHTPRTLMLSSAAVRWAKKPLVYHVHSPTSRNATKRILGWVNAAVETFSMGNCARLITVSHSLRRHMQYLGFEHERITVVSNGVPIATKPRSAKPPKGKWTLGTVSLIRPGDGTEVLLDTLSQLRFAGHDVRLRAVGLFETTVYEQQLRDLADRLNINQAIDWVGFTEDVGAELQMMDLFVQPSLFDEELPLIVLEAMAAGVPPIGTTVDGVSEAIKNGWNGLLAKPNPQDLARVIATVIEGEVDWSDLHRNAIKHHGEEFSDLSMASGVSDVYRSVLS